ncbi:MAG: hypothetical protein RLZZ584_1818 [Pseudomonadota bacterium]|jgi:hypothetical protein
MIAGMRMLPVLVIVSTLAQPLAVQAAPPPPGAGTSPAGQPPAAPTATGGPGAAPVLSGLRLECNVGRPHVEVRNCMVTRARASTQDVENTELALRTLLDSRAEAQPQLRRSAGQFDAAAKAFARFRLQYCEFAASLVVGQGPQREQRLACTHELNLRRKQQLAELRENLP